MSEFSAENNEANLSSDDIAFIQSLSDQMDSSVAPFEQAERETGVLAAAGAEVLRAAWRIEDEPNGILADVQDIIDNEGAGQGVLTPDHSLLDRMRSLDEQTITFVTGVEPWDHNAKQKAIEAAAKMLEERNNPYDKE